MTPRDCCSAFFEVQKHETPYTSGDLFIMFDVPFDNSIQYSRELKEALFGQYEASRQDLKEEGIEPDWQAYPEQLRIPLTATSKVSVPSAPRITNRSAI